MTGHVVKQNEGQLRFYCPGCQTSHPIQTGRGHGFNWTWNGSLDKPTFSPSVLVTWRDPVNLGNVEALQADLERKRKDGTPIPYADRVCHSFVTDGRIQYLSDCTHPLAGQTVDLPEWKEIP